MISFVDNQMTAYENGNAYPIPFLMSTHDSTKQDTLTAGTNITIENNVISSNAGATDADSITYDSSKSREEHTSGSVGEKLYSLLYNMNYLFTHQVAVTYSTGGDASVESSHYANFCDTLKSAENYTATIYITKFKDGSFSQAILFRASENEGLAIEADGYSKSIIFWKLKPSSYEGSRLFTITGA